MTLAVDDQLEHGAMVLAKPEHDEVADPRALDARQAQPSTSHAARSHEVPTARLGVQEHCPHTEPAEHVLTERLSGKSAISLSQLVVSASDRSRRLHSPSCGNPATLE